jgi:hypothetical protein
MYSRFVKILKFIQILGYIGVLIIGSFYVKRMAPFGLGTPYTILFLVYLIFLCLLNYIGTQTIISVIDLLNRIEINTRNSRQN